MAKAVSGFLATLFQWLAPFLAARFQVSMPAAFQRLKLFLGRNELRLYRGV